MKYHMSWDKNSASGIIYNAHYDGVLCKDNKYAPKMSFDYDGFVFSEVHPIENHIYINQEKRPMIKEEEQECLKMAQSWVQPLGQEGNLSPAQLEQLVRNRASGIIQQTESMLSHLSGALSEEELEAIIEYREWLQSQIENPVFPMNFKISKALETAGAKFNLKFSNEIRTKGIWVAP